MSIKQHQAGLVLAHPGHELLILNWIEDNRPIVSILTDGSGSTGCSRLTYSQDILTERSARMSTVFGRMTDQDWYGHLISADPAPFLKVRDELVAEFSKADVDVVISDALEYYNPCHDIACVIADSVAAMISSRQHRDIQRYTIPIDDKRPEAIPNDNSGDLMEFSVTDDARVRKIRTLNTYEPLASEIQTYQENDGPGIRRETMQAHFPLLDHPKELAFMPYYEAWGRQRVAEGIYENLITYRHHVRPICQTILSNQL